MGEFFTLYSCSFTGVAVCSSCSVGGEAIVFGRGAVGGWSGSVLEVVGGGEIPDSLVFACEEALEVMSEEMIAVGGEAELIVGRSSIGGRERRLSRIVFSYIKK